MAAPTGDDRNTRASALPTVGMVHDRVHAREPHDPENWRVGVIRAVTERDGHAVFVVAPEQDAGGTADLMLTFDVRDLVLRRLGDGEPVGQRVWFRKRGEGG